MERFIFEVIEPLLNKEEDETQRQTKLDRVSQELKSFIKGELIPINKQLAKKTRELFVASSDVESLRESLQKMEREMNQVRSEVSLREQDMMRQRIHYEKQIAQLKEEVEKLQKEIKKITQKYQNEIQKINELNKDRIIELKKEHRLQMQRTLQKQRKMAEETLQSHIATSEEEKRNLILEANKQKSKIIKKYQEKLFNQKNESQEVLFKVTTELNDKIQSLKSVKGELETKLSHQQGACRRLANELEKEIKHNTKYKSNYQQMQKDIEIANEKSYREKVALTEENQNLKAKMRQESKDHFQAMKKLQTLLQNTIIEKDKKFIDTTETMATEFQIEIDSLRNNMMEEKEIALNGVQVRAYQEMFQQIKKYEKLESQYQVLVSKYNEVNDHYEKLMKKTKEDHEIELYNLQERKQYQFVISGQNSKRQYSNLKNKFNLEIQSLKSQHIIDMENLQKKGQEEKIALSNKLISQYETMLADQRSNTEIQIKQKIIEFERKAKAFEKRLAESQKRKSELKVIIQRQKIESVMKIESMMEVNQKYEAEIEQLQQKVLQLEKAKSSLINDYQYQILLLKNEIQKVKDDYEQKQEELRSNLNDKITVKNKQIAKFAEKVKQETEELIRRHRQRVIAIEKQYQELKKVVTAKTSLPQDIEALKVFHAAYVEKERELIAEKQKRQELQRQLHSKDAIEKVFATKQSFVSKRIIGLDKMAQTSKQFVKFTNSQM